MLGAVGFLAVPGLEPDIFGQIGLLLLVGLAAKDSILLVSFAEDLRRQGEGVLKAAQDAARLRMRPILMTSYIAFERLFGAGKICGEESPRRESGPQPAEGAAASHRRRLSTG